MSQIHEYDDNDDDDDDDGRPTIIFHPQSIDEVCSVPNDTAS